MADIKTQIHCHFPQSAPIASCFAEHDLSLRNLAAPFGTHGSPWKRRISGSTFRAWLVPSSL
ncbi:hypothetical protein [uncultured Sphingopyxis sp.]|uniref:hypothetical protein n=1 Tax=uncultured Sphingopyxis sp. TaxID=310581 RepID=UPI0025D0AC60|nr:hypothetical protein [uncultured Sphingopyxis sp.]